MREIIRLNDGLYYEVEMSEVEVGNIVRDYLKNVLIPEYNKELENRKVISTKINDKGQEIRIIKCWESPIIAREIKIIQDDSTETIKYFGDSNFMSEEEVIHLPKGTFVQALNN